MPPSHSSTTSGLPWLLWLDSFNRLQLCLQYNYYQTTIFTCHLCWIHNFLIDRPQAERLGSTAFTTIIVNTDCVLSPFLYTLYSNDCLSPSPFKKYFKYSDDTGILTLLTARNQLQHISNLLPTSPNVVQTVTSSSMSPKQRNSSRTHAINSPPLTAPSPSMARD